jgi:HK97 family phage major capsid protein
MSTNVSQKTIDDIASDISKFGGNIQGLTDSTNRSLAEMRGLIDAHGTKASNEDAVLKERIDKFAAEIETKQGTLEGAVDALKAVMDRPTGAWKGEDGASEAAQAFAFHRTMLAKSGSLKVLNGAKPADVDHEAIRNWNAHYDLYLRRDTSASRTAEFVGALSTGSDPDGGYLVPEQNSARIITKIFETSPIRQYATVETIAGKDITFARDEDEAAFGWVGETDNRPETNTPRLGESKITAHEMYAKPKATQTLLEDAGIDAEAWLNRKVAERFGRAEAGAFVNGDGLNKPRGYMTYPNGTTGAAIEQIVSGNATQITGDSIWDLVFSVKDGFTANARHFMRRTTVRDVMKLKDGQGNYLWSQGDIVGGQPATLAGYAIVRAEDMPLNGAGALAIAFGDMAQAYTIIDRLGINVLRDPYSEKPFVQFYTRRRVGGDVLNFEALKLLRVSV